MPTYTYETVETDGSVERFEVKQSFDDPPLRVHPTSGRPVRRVISGGMGLVGVGAEKSGAAEPGPGCGPDTCQCGRFN